MTTHIHDNITSLKNEITEYTREVWEKGVLTLQPRRRSLTIQALKVPGPGSELSWAHRSSDPASWPEIFDYVQA